MASNWIKDFATGLTKPLFGVISEVVRDKDKADALAAEITTIIENNAHSLQRGQIDTNIQEAKHSSIFVAGWRPAVGWTCAVALFYNYILVHLIEYGIILWGPTGLQMPPRLDLGDLFMLLTGMLGFGTLRTYERINGVERSNMDEAKSEKAARWPWQRSN